MRLPFPEQIPLRYAFYFAVLLCTAQLLQGTPALISLCCFLFILIATYTFNLAGGFTRTSGGYVFFYAVLVVILGISWKAVLGEPADSKLKQPLLTFQIYTGGIVAMLAAVYLGRKLTLKRALLANTVTDANMASSATGCMIAGFALTAVLTLIPHQSATGLSALDQLNVFLPLAMILAVIAQIRRSRGTSSVNLTVLISGGLILAEGLVSFSKQGIFTAPLCWLIAAASQRYRLTFYQVIGFSVTMILMFYYLVPYSGYGKNIRTGVFREDVDSSISMLFMLDQIREQSAQTVDTIVEDRVQAYYDTPQGFFDRLQMISPDDALNNVTEEKGRIGFMPLYLYFGNLIPHVLWPGKPVVAFGNVYAHEIGMIGAEDTSTGVSFSPTGEAFHLGRWVGIFVVAPLLWTLLFIVFDSLCGDVRRYPWGLLVIVLFSHAAPEGMLGGTIHLLGIGALGIVFAAFTSAYIMPIVGALVSVPERLRLRRTAPVRSIPRRLPPIRPSENSGR